MAGASPTPVDTRPSEAFVTLDHIGTYAVWRRRTQAQRRRELALPWHDGHDLIARQTAAVAGERP